MTSALPLRLFLIRHGETEWSVSGRHTGQTDIALTQNGENQARELGGHLQGIKFNQVLTSPLKRARQTCFLVDLPNTPKVDEDLSECDYGDYEGRRSSEVSKARPDWSLFRDGCPNGETSENILERADRLIRRLRSMHGNVALFSHGQFGAALAVRWLDLELIQAQHFPLNTASLSVLSFHPHHLQIPIIAAWNAALP